MKKGDISMNTIVMAVIAVLVLVILSSIIIRNLGNTSEEFARCPVGGSCVDNVGADSCEAAGLPFNYQPANSYSCIDNGQIQAGLVCCIPG